MLKNAGIWPVKTITKTSLKSVIDKSPTTMILGHKTGNLKYEYEYADMTNLII